MRQLSCPDQFLQEDIWAISRDNPAQGSRLDAMDEGLRELLLAPRKVTVEEAISCLKTGLLKYVDCNTSVIRHQVISYC